jgi:hypothetical protein
MATATKKRPAKKSVKKKAARKVVKKAPVPKAKSSAKPSKNGAAVKSAGSEKFDPQQPPLVGMEDVDERIPALEEACQKAISNRGRKESASADFADDLESIGDLLEFHEMDCYICSGKKFFIEPGEPHVKMQKVKQ